MFLVLILFNLGPKERIRPHMGTPVPAPVLCQCLVTSKEGPVGRSCQFRAEKRPPRPPPTPAVNLHGVAFHRHTQDDADGRPRHGARPTALENAKAVRRHPSGPHAVSWAGAAVTKRSREQACPLGHVQKLRPKHPWLGAHVPGTINNRPLEPPLLRVCAPGCHSVTSCGDKALSAFYSFKNTSKPWPRTARPGPPRHALQES